MGGTTGQGQQGKDRDMNMDGIGGKLAIAAALALAGLLGGCVAYPADGGYYGGGYYAAPAYPVAPPVFGFWGGDDDEHGHGRHWR